MFPCSNDRDRDIAIKCFLDDQTSPPPLNFGGKPTKPHGKLLIDVIFLRQSILLELQRVRESIRFRPGVSISSLFADKTSSMLPLHLEFCKQASAELLDTDGEWTKGKRYAFLPLKSLAKANYVRIISPLFLSSSLQLDIYLFSYNSLLLHSMVND